MPYSERMIIRTRRTKIITLIIVLLLVIGGGAAWYFLQNRQAVTLPQDVVSKTLFQIYVPSQLPQGFYVDEKTIVHDNDVLLFQLKDGDGRVIALTEQSIPAKFDFEDFYKKQVTNPRTISGTPFHSVIGDTAMAEGAGIKMLSIRADNTWVMVSGQRVGEAELEFIAKHLRRL